MTLGRGKFRVRGDTIEVHPAYDETVLRIEMFGDTVDRLTIVDPLTGEQLRELSEVMVFPATHYVAGDERMRRAVVGIEAELQERLACFEKEGKLLEAQRLRMRTQYDLEMIQEVGYCNGIENYSMHIDGRSHGEPPFTLLDYFPDDFLLVIDESHVSVPQLHGQYEGDRSRKDILVEHGFRLPERPGQPAAALRGGDASASTSASSCRPRRPTTSCGCATRSSSRSCARPAWSTPRWSSSRPRARSTTSSSRSTSGSPRATACSSPRSPRRWPRTSPTTCSSWACGCATSTRSRHHPAHRDPAGAAPRRVRRARRHQPAAGGPRPARGVAGRHPRRRQGGLPALRDEPHPDDRPRRPQRRRPGRHVRRQGHRLDAAGHQRDEPPPQAPERLQRRARHRPADDPQGRHRHPVAAPAGRDGAGARARTGDASGSGTRCATSWPSCPQSELVRLIQTLEEEMHEAAAELRFEYAARLRDEVNELKRELREAG